MNDISMSSSSVVTVEPEDEHLIRVGDRNSDAPVLPAELMTNRADNQLKMSILTINRHTVLIPRPGNLSTYRIFAMLLRDSRNLNEMKLPMGFKQSDKAGRAGNPLPRWIRAASAGVLWNWTHSQ